MTVPYHSRLLPTLSLIPVAASLIVISLGCLALLGWLFDLAALRSVFSGWPSMVPNTALGLILSGGSLWLLRQAQPAEPSPKPWMRRVGRISAALVMLLACLALSEYLFDWDFGLDRWLFAGKIAEDSQPFPGRIAVGSILSFLLAGGALLLMEVETKSGWRPAQPLALTAFIIALVVLLCYGYGAIPFSSASVFPGMALHTALAFLALTIGIFCARPEKGMMAVVTNNSAGGFMVRRLLMAAILVPAVLGWMRVAGQRVGYYDTALGTAILVGTSIVVFLIIVWRNAELLHVTDTKRRLAEETLRHLNTDLEQRVTERTAELAAINAELRREVSERERAEAELRGKQEELADLFENATVGLHLVGADGKILQANQAELDMLGYLREEYIGRSIADFHADAEVIEDILQRLQQGETLHGYEARLRAKDGSIRHVVISSNVRWDNGRFLHTRCFTRDVTERKQIEEEQELLLKREQIARALAEETEMRYHSLVHGVDAIVWEADAATFQFTFVSHRAEDILGYPPDQWLREPSFWVNLIHADDRDRAIRICQEATAAGRDHDFEYRAVAADGRIVWLYDKVYVVRDSEGKARQLRGLMVDITERQRAEEERKQLLASEQAARVQAEQSAEIIRRLQAVTDSALANLALDDLLREMLGRIRELLNVDAATILLLSENAQELTICATAGLEEEVRANMHIPVGQGIIGQIAATRAPLVVDDLAEVEMLGLVLREKMCSFVGVPLLVEGRVIGVMHADTSEFRHFTEDDVRLLQLVADRVALAIEQSRLYEAEQRARRHAESANRMKDEFLATVSHELRSPLNAILGWVKLLREGKLEAEPAARALETIERSARSQNRIINDLLDVSRIITGQLRLNVRPIEPGRFVEAAIETVRPAAEAKEIRLQTVLDYDAGPISGDSDRLQQIVWNLISNAIKFTPKGGRVQVRLERVNSHIEITVSDTGAGISSEFLPFVFDRFRQADSSSTRRHSGLGLGLAIVRHLTELHGGAIDVTSPGEGQGSTFVVKLPLMVSHSRSLDSARAHPAVEENTPTDCPPQLDGLLMLVVDDDADAREVIATILTQCGAKVRSAASANEALAILADWQPEVLISDIEMPEMNGYGLIQKIRALEPEQGGRIPAVALTAYTRIEDRLRALAAGFQMHVPKPVDPAELVTIVASLAGRLGQKGVGRTV